MKYSRAKAFTEIELYNPTGHNPIIRREITRDSNSSSWILNGKGCQMKEVREKYQLLALCIIEITILGPESCC